MKNIPTDIHTAPTNLAADDARPRAIIKLGIDAHADDFRVVVMSEGRLPKSARRFTSVAELVNFAAGLVRGAAEVHSCYEAGPLGYGLHRALCAVGVNNRVVVPVNLDESGKREKTDAKYEWTAITPGEVEREEERKVRETAERKADSSLSLKRLVRQSDAGMRPFFGCLEEYGRRGKSIWRFQCLNLKLKKQSTRLSFCLCIVWMRGLLGIMQCSKRYRRICIRMLVHL